MSLSDEERKAIVDYRIERAQKSFEEATNVMAMGMWSLLANRLYYTLYSPWSHCLSKMDTYPKRILV